MPKTRVTPETVLGLVETLYTAALRPSALTAFCADLNKATDCHLGGVLLQDYQHSDGQYIASPGFDQSLIDAYKRDWASRNILMERALPDMRPGLVCVSEQHVTASEWTRADYYNGFAKPHDAFYVAGGCISYDRGVSAMVTLGRSRRRGSYSAQDLNLIRCLLPHLRNVLEIQRRLGFLELRSEAAWQFVDRLPFAVFCVTASLSICFANRRARALLTTNEGISERNGNLVLMNRPDRQTLQELCDGCTKEVGKRGGPIRVQRDAQRPPLTGYICPLDVANSFPSFVQQPVAIVLLADPLTEAGGVEEALRVYFNTTPAEARLALRLLRGMSLKAIADDLRISMNTVKTHLKELMRRTNTNRQSQLVARLLQGMIHFDLEVTTRTSEPVGQGVVSRGAGQ